MVGYTSDYVWINCDLTAPKSLLCTVHIPPQEMVYMAGLECDPTLALFPCCRPARRLLPTACAKYKDARKYLLHGTIFCKPSKPSQILTSMIFGTFCLANDRGNVHVMYLTYCLSHHAACPLLTPCVFVHGTIGLTEVQSIFRQV